MELVHMLIRVAMQRKNVAYRPCSLADSQQAMVDVGGLTNHQFYPTATTIGQAISSQR